jgi:ABC-2 type transport system ATP-binding protein
MRHQQKKLSPHLSQKPADVGITLSGISRNFGSVRALDTLSLSFDADLLHGIIGSDGAGKTTLMRIIAGLLHADSGTMTYYSGQQNFTFEQLRPYIAYMPSRPSLYPDLSIQEHLSFFKSLYQLSADEFKRKSAELLSITRLERFKDRRVGQLSGGMYKKVGLMCALLQSPSVLLLDEPTNGVDPISRREFWELLYGLNAEKILIIISTAYMDEAERCGKVHLLESGKELLSGEPGDLLKKERAKTFDEIFIRGICR